MKRDRLGELQALRKRVAELERLLAEGQGGNRQGQGPSADIASFILANAPDAIVFCDAHYRITEWNPGAERVFGYSREEALGRLLDELVTSPEAHPEAYEQALQLTRLVSEGERIPPTHVVRYRKDGSLVHLIISSAPVLSEGKLIGTVTIYTDITERLRAERREERRSRELASLSRTAEELAGLPVEDDIYHVIAERLHEMLGEQSIVMVNSYEPGMRALCARALVGAGPAFEAALNILGQSPLGMTFGLSGEDRSRLSSGKVLELGANLFELFAGRVPEELCKAVERVLGLGRLYTLGFAYQGDLLGNAAFFWGPGDERVDWTPLEVFAGQASAALQRRREQAIQSVLYRIAQAVSAPGTLIDFLRTVHQELSGLMDTANFYVALYDPQEGLYSFPYSVDSDDLVGNHISPQQLRRSLTDYVRRTGRSLLVNEDLHGELMRLGEVDLVGSPSRVWLGVPLKTSKGVIGVLSVQSYDDPLAFTQSDLRLLELVAPQIATAIEHKRAEDALRASEELYRTLVATSPDAITLYDLEWRITSASPRTASLHGYETVTELVGKHALELIAPEEHARATKDCDKILTEGVGRGLEYTMLRKDGGRFIGELNAALIRDAQGRPKAFIATVRDVTERKRLEEQLRQAQKMEAIGRLAGGIAHDFNNLLTVINGYSQMLLNSLEADSPLRADVEAILHAGERAANLTRQLLAFSRRQVLEVRLLNLNEILMNMIKMLQRIIGEDISLELNLAEDLGKVRADPGQIEQVVLNLAVNGRDAMPDGGELIIETANVELDKEAIQRHSGLEPGRYVLLAISDTGLGMSAEVRKHLFEPFFTTKEVGQGTGLGLATVYGIVKQSGGDISVYSEPGRGTTFKIYLPRVDETDDSAHGLGRSTAKDIPRGKETILVVEDNEEVRQVAVLALRNLGYRVLEARNGLEAIQLFQAQPEAIHLVLTDVVMTGMSGREMAEQLKQIQKGLRVLYMSGYTDAAVVRHGILEPGTPFIQKPFAVETLARKVRELLDVG